MESRREEPPVVPEASERLLTQSTRALRLARELALSADSSTIAQLLARHGGEIFGARLVGVPPRAQIGIHPSLLVTATELAGASLANARRLALTHAEARRDPLTDLGNHRAFQEHLDGALQRAHTGASHVTLLLCDLDDFKRLNDQEGHPAGDRVLRELARTLA